MKVLITGSSKFPVPAVQGGAVPNLIEELIQQQEVENKIELDCCTLWDPKAEAEAEKFTHTNFVWAKKPRYIDLIDRSLTSFFKNICRMKRLHSVGFLFQVIWFAFYIAKVLKKNDYDKVIFENSVPMLFALKLYGNKKKYANKYYIHMHSVPRKYYGNNKEFSSCKGLISVSNYVAREIYADKRIHVSKQQIKLMYNCIDTVQMSPKSVADKKTYMNIYGIPANKKIILFAGRLCKDKGIEEVIKSIKLLDNPKYVLVVVGSNFYNSGIVSPYEEYLQELSSEIQDQITFTGFVDYSLMPYIYNMADVVVLPSVWEEPAGMTIIEAMACGKPVITTDSGGIPEYVGEKNCILLQKNERLIENIADNIKRILDNNDYSCSLCKKGRERAKMFSKSFYYKQFLDIINED